jgi:hypothetical protein
VGERSPEAWFGTEGNPGVARAVGLALGLAALASGVALGGGAFCMLAFVLGPDPADLLAAAALGLLFGLAPVPPLLGLAALVRWRMRPRRWAPDAIPLDLLP